MKTKTQHFEFSGPYFGPIAIVIGLPVLCYILAWLVDIFDPLQLHAFWLDAEIVSVFGFATVFGYFSVVVLLHLILPAKIVRGTLLANGENLNYRLNGLFVFLLIYGVIVCGTFVTESVRLSVIHDHWISCLSASIALSTGLSICLYIHSFKQNALLAKGGQTGYHWYDFFIGRELNPRLRRLDLKEFCELYPGLIGWSLLNLSNLHKQFEMLGYVTNSMILVNIFHLIYVFDALYHEPSILTTMDITSDGFGFMLAFGDLTWVPFIYALQTKYLVHHPTELSSIFAFSVIVLNVCGYMVFRGANGQKDQFRRDPKHPSVVHLKTLKTSKGRRLIISSWWGLARHINYTGDWLLGLSWCLPCGFASPVPYFYVIYFGVLLIHRDRRDELACREKYGSDWDAYCQIVPYRFIPLVY